MLGHGGVPASGVQAVVLNVTATAPTATSFVTVWPGGTDRPGTSNLNFTAGQTVPNLVIAPVGADGTVDLYNRAGTVQLVADVSGWFTAGSLLEPGGLGTLTPDRLMDTRTGLGAAGPVGPGQTVHLKVLGDDGVPVSGVGAVVLTVTVTQPTAAHSFVTVWPDGKPRPGTSNLNFTAGQTRANLVIAPVGADGVVNFYNSAGTVQLVADVSGWFATGSPPPASGGLAPLDPTRILDTRIPGVGGVIGPVGPGQTVSLPVLGHAGIPASGVQAVVLNVTATEPTATGFATVWADGQARPATSNLNFTAGQTVANTVIAPVGADGNVDFYNSAGNTQLIADVSGWFASPANGPPSP